ncbi:MAG: hypothetical protein ACD_62C00464G0002 [uncultured bacterium]|nr:MAG: hypothetical protein ACD_62C00464G0002 [uncultured bacterium]HLD45107.1 hypothetical protein [bacterium]
MNNYTKRLVTIVLLMMAFVFTSCAGLSNPITPSEGDEQIMEDPQIDSTPPTSSTTLGNPTLDVSVTGNVFLTDNNASDNLKQVTGDDVFSVLSLVDPDVGTETLTESPTTDIPSVKYFGVGTDSQLVMFFDEAISVADADCYVVYAYEDEQLCLESSQFTIVGDVQFDKAGNIYYFGQENSADVQTLVRWDPETAERKLLINQNITLTQWMVHADGSVYLLGESGGIGFFRKMNTDGSLVNIFSSPTVISQFNFISSELMIAEGDFVYYNDDWSLGLFVISLADFSVKDRILLSDVDLTTLKIDSQNRVFALSGYHLNQKLYQIYPKSIVADSLVNLGLNQIKYFEIINDILYAEGMQDTNEVLVQLDLNLEVAVSGVREATVLCSGYEVYHLIENDGALYFDGLDFANNTMSLFRFDTETLTLSPLVQTSDALVQLLSNKAYENPSFRDRVFEVENIPTESGGAEFIGKKLEDSKFRKPGLSASALKLLD